VLLLEAASMGDRAVADQDQATAGGLDGRELAAQLRHRLFTVQSTEVPQERHQQRPAGELAEPHHGAGRVQRGEIVQRCDTVSSYIRHTAIIT
jgi:hypothetical protein